MTCTISHKFEIIKGAGLLYLKPSPDDIYWSLYGFWYQSSIMCKSQIYIIPFENTKSLPGIHNFGLTLEKLLFDLSRSTLLRFYKFNDSNREGIFRSYIFTCLSSIDVNIIKPDLPEKTLNLFNYYFQAYIKTLKPTNNNESSLDQKLEFISQLLQPIFDQCEQQPDLINEIGLPDTDNSDINISTDNELFTQLTELIYNKNSNEWVIKD